MNYQSVPNYVSNGMEVTKGVVKRVLDCLIDYTDEFIGPKQTSSQYDEPVLLWGPLQLATRIERKQFHQEYCQIPSDIEIITLPMGVDSKKINSVDDLLKL